MPRIYKIFGEVYDIHKRELVTREQDEPEIIIEVSKLKSSMGKLDIDTSNPDPKKNPKPIKDGLIKTVDVNKEKGSYEVSVNVSPHYPNEALFVLLHVIDNKGTYNSRNYIIGIYGDKPYFPIDEIYQEIELSDQIISIPELALSKRKQINRGSRRRKK